MFVAKDFARRRFLAQICANSCAHAHFGAYLRDEPLSNRILGCERNIGTIPKNMLTNFHPKRLKLNSRGPNGIIVALLAKNDFSPDITS